MEEELRTIERKKKERTHKNILRDPGVVTRYKGIISETDQLNSYR